MGERLRGTASGWSSLGVEEHPFDSWPPSQFHQETQKRQTWAMPRKQTAHHDPGFPWSSPHLQIPLGQRLPGTWETSQVALPEPLNLPEKATSPRPAAVLVHTKCGWMEAHRPLLRGGDAGFGRRGAASGKQPVVGVRAACSECALPRPLSSPRARGRHWGRTLAICSAPLVCGWGEPGREGKRTSIGPARGNLHFLAQSILEGLETGTGGGARARREKGCLWRRRSTLSFWWMWRRNKLRAIVKWIHTAMSSVVFWGC